MLIMESSDPGIPPTRITHESPAWGLLVEFELKDSVLFDGAEASVES